MVNRCLGEWNISKCAALIGAPKQLVGAAVEITGGVF
jgi:hypothetical protein